MPVFQNYRFTEGWIRVADQTIGTFEGSLNSSGGLTLTRLRLVQWSRRISTCKIAQHVSRWMHVAKVQTFAFSIGYSTGLPQ